MGIGRLSSVGGELGKRQHASAMPGSFAPLPDGNPNFLCRSVAHSIQENWSLGVDRCTRPSPRIATNLGRSELCRSPVSEPAEDPRDFVGR
jgi:hypothetical protein